MTEPHRIITVRDLQVAAADRLVGLAVGSFEMRMAVAALRAEMLAGIMLVVDVPDHGHPHVLTDILVVDPPGPGRAGEVRLLPTYDDCPGT